MELKNKVLEFAIECGMKARNPRDSDESSRICSSKITEPRGGGNAVIRDNSDREDGALYFGFIRPEEPLSQSYHDFSLVFFPKINDVDGIKQVTTCVVF